MTLDAQAAFMRYGQAKGWWRRGTAFRYYCGDVLFKGVRLQGRRVLDVGCGNGRYSLWAACQGADEVLGLEPSAEGSRGNKAVQEFREGVRTLGFQNVEIEEQTFQSLKPHAKKWDVTLIHAAINHLDEPACITLLEDSASWQKYIEIGRSLRAIMPQGGDLVVVDVGRRNYYGDRGRVNPHAPTIEWEKHQQPEAWAQVLSEAGFGMPRIDWIAQVFLGPLGRPFRNRLCAYYGASRFRLHMRAV